MQMIQRRDSTHPHVRSKKSRLKCGIGTLLMILLFISVVSLLLLLSYNYFVKKASCILRFIDPAVKYSTQQLSTANRFSNKTNNIFKDPENSITVDSLYESKCFIDKKHKTAVFYRHADLQNAIYDEAISIGINFDLKKSTIIGPNEIINPIIQIENKNPSGDAILKSNLKLHSFFSSKTPKMRLLPELADSDYILKPLLTFRDKNCIMSNRIWYLTRPVEQMYTRDSYNDKEIAVIVKATLFGINSALKADYFVEDFEKFEVLVMVSEASPNPGKLRDILSAQIFDNGNFVESKFLPNNIKNNYMLNLKKFLMNMISRLSIHKDPETSTEVYGIRYDDGNVTVTFERVSLQMIDFYLVISDLVENKATEISELLDHPFMKGSLINGSDRHGKRAGYNQGIVIRNHANVQQQNRSRGT